MERAPKRLELPVVRPIRAVAADQAAPVDDLGREVEACLDLDAVSVEIHHLLGVDAFGAFEVAVFDRVDLARIAAMYQCAGRGGIQQGFDDGFDGGCAARAELVPRQACSACSSRW